MYGGKRDRRQDLPSCAVMVVLFWLVGGLCVLTAPAYNCKSCYFSPAFGWVLLVVGGIVLDLAMGAIAIGIAIRRHDWGAVCCLGIVILAGIVAVAVQFLHVFSYRPAAPIWSQVATSGLLTLALLPALTAFMYGLARPRLVLALTVLTLSAALAVVIAHLQ